VFDCDRRQYSTCEIKSLAVDILLIESLFKSIDHRTQTVKNIFMFFCQYVNNIFAVTHVRMTEFCY